MSHANKRDLIDIATNVWENYEDVRSAAMMSIFSSQAISYGKLLLNNTPIYMCWYVLSSSSLKMYHCLASKFTYQASFRSYWHYESLVHPSPTLIRDHWLRLIATVPFQYFRLGESSHTTIMTLYIWHCIIYQLIILYIQRVIFWGCVSIFGLGALFQFLALWTMPKYLNIPYHHLRVYCNTWFPKGSFVYQQDNTVIHSISDSFLNKNIIQ